MNLTSLALVLALTPFAKGTVERLTMAAPSVGDAHRTVRVYLPADYATSATRRYPVVYLLHGWPGSDGNWFSMGHAPQIADSMIADGEIPSVILVCPNGSGRGLVDRTFYMNSQDGRMRMEDYIAHDVVAWTDSTFRTIAVPRDRAVIGLSDGATAALNLAFRHTDVFGACGGHSGDYRLPHSFAARPVLGPEPGASRLLAEYSPVLYADQVAPRLGRTTIYFDTGAGDEDVGDSRDLDQTLARLGVAHTYREFPGTHTWGYWREHLHDSLRAVTAAMR